MLVRSLILAGLLIPIFAAVSSAQAGPAQLKVRHIHVWVKDVNSTKAFYRDKLGLTVTSERAGEVVEFEGGSLWFGKARFSGPIQTNGITIGIHADSVAAAYRALQQKGIDIAHPPEQHGERWAIFFEDPDGYKVEVEGGK
ncbi:MAG: VOC family protein [Acidobacteria bacterium]|nr:VOC family protein [Acidobacteriota bacterium]